VREKKAQGGVDCVNPLEVIAARIASLEQAQEALLERLVDLEGKK